MTRLRLTIAKRLKAQENAAMLTTFNEVDMSGYLIRTQYKDNFKNYRLSLALCHFCQSLCYRFKVFQQLMLKYKER